MIDWSAFLAACAALAHGEVASGLLAYGLPGGLFLLGLVGGATHCAGMCGPFVLAQAGSRLAATPLQNTTMLTRLRGMALVPYHLGRMTTYGLLGGLAGGATGGVQVLTTQGQIPGVVLAATAAIFLVMAAAQLLPLRQAAGAVGLTERWQGLLSPLFARPTGLSGYALGLGLGFLPCGLVYTALLMVGAAGDWRMGALGMAAFAAGTVPALLVIGMLGAAAGQRLRQSLRFWLAPVFLFNAFLAGAMAWRWLAG